MVDVIVAVPTYAIEELTQLRQEYRKCIDAIEDLTMRPYVIDFFMKHNEIKTFIEERRQVLNWLHQHKDKLMEKIQTEVGRYVKKELVDRTTKKILKMEFETDNNI